jgi:hypothetical protein
LAIAVEKLILFSIWRSPLQISSALQKLYNTINKPNRFTNRSTSSNRSYTISQLQSIINTLKQVQNGTTVYLEAQSQLLSAQNKLSQFKP